MEGLLNPEGGTRSWPLSWVNCLLWGQSRTWCFSEGCSKCLHWSKGRKTTDLPLGPGVGVIWQAIIWNLWSLGECSPFKVSNWWQFQAGTSCAVREWKFSHAKQLNITTAKREPVLWKKIGRQPMNLFSQVLYEVFGNSHLNKTKVNPWLGESLKPCPAPGLLNSSVWLRVKSWNPALCEMSQPPLNQVNWTWNLSLDSSSENGFHLISENSC